MGTASWEGNVTAMAVLPTLALLPVMDCEAANSLMCDSMATLERPQSVKNKARQDVVLTNGWWV